MYAYIIANYNGSLNLPTGLAIDNYSLHKPLLDRMGNPVKALVVVEASETTLASIAAKTYPEVEFVGYAAVEDIQGMRMAGITQNQANDTFKVKLAVLTADGYLDPVTNVRIKGGDDEMKGRWGPLTTSVLNMRSLGVAGTTPITTVDYDNNNFTLTMDEYQQMMMRFAIWFNEKFTEANS